MSERRVAQHATGTGGRGARRRILDAAAELFYREGINATGVERLASRASVSKRTLYQHFPSKTAVIEAYLSRIHQDVGDPIKLEPDATNKTARARLAALFDTPQVRSGPIRGCPFHNAAVEAAAAMPGVHSIVAAHKRNFADALAKLAEQAGAVDPQVLGNQLAVLYEGAAALATSLDDPSPWAHAQAAAETLIDQAVAG